MGLRSGDVLALRLADDSLIMERRATVLTRLRERFSAVPKSVSLADELIADRREEAGREGGE